ncbi:preprotein translocase subunit YajC [Paenibacillus sp. N1-5-1-14]|uniref:preprotein translocase subunit YajC n=1 Tax=Paenibacillus radicibacter TaxID=2972488 RepID=UPI0021591B28|nr:preprotein translocase subunit YajC [Paenibacillus radicibacter]MCR8644113.1 preprotein translocase subunit YajC [Paenibacillus radicibacter]
MLLADAAATGSSWMTFLPLIVMVVLFYFLLIRPQQKRTKTRNMMLGNVKKGDKVVTIGGLHGTIVELTDDTMVLRVNDATKLTFDRSAINTVVSSTEASAS